jgi:hypothetical protein
MTRPGFVIVGLGGAVRWISYLEKQGLKRTADGLLGWHIRLYSAPHLSVPAVFRSKAKYDRFCSETEHYCYSSFYDFLKEFQKEKEHGRGF